MANISRLIISAWTYSARTYSARTWTHLGLLGMAALWGASWPWGQVVAQAMPPLAAASLRFILASCVLLLWLARTGRLRGLLALSPQQWLGMAIASSVGVLGYSMFFMLALKTVPASRATMVVALNPVLTMLFASILFREAVNGMMVTGVILAVTGALTALTNGSLLALHPSQSSIGEILLLGCALCWVTYTLIGRRVLTSLDSLTTTTVTAVIGALLLLLASLVLEGPQAWLDLVAAPAPAWFCLFALALGATALAYAWYLNGVKVLGAGPAAAYISLVPLFGILCSNLWLGQPMTVPLISGGAIALIGMLMMNVGRNRLES